MALPYITGRQGQVLSTEVVEKMAAEGKIGTGSGSGFEKITSANDLLTIPSEETMGKIYQYEGKDYLINVTEKSEELSVDVDPDIFYNKVQVKDKDFKFEVIEDTWKLNQVKQFELIDWSESVKAYSSDTVSFGIEPNKQYTVKVNYEGYQKTVPMGPYYEGFNGIVTSAEEYPEGYYTYIEGTYYLDPDPDAQKYLVAIMGYDGVHFDATNNSEPAFSGTVLVVAIMLNESEIVYPTLGEEVDILDENGKSIIKSMEEVDLNEYGITVKGAKENSNFIVRSNSVMYNKYELYQVTADSKNLPGTPIEVDSDNLKVYINNEVDITKCINNFGGVPQGSEFYGVSYDLLTTTNGENSNFTVVVKDGEKWKEFLKKKDVPEAARKEITFKCVYDDIEGTEEELEAGLKMLYTDNNLLFINNSDSSVKQNYMNILTEAIEVRDLEENVFDWNQSQDFESNIIKGGDNFTIKIDDKGNVTAVVNPRIKESITYVLCLLHPESPDTYYESIGYSKLPIRNDAVPYLSEYPNLGNVIYASKLIVDAMAEEGIIIKTNSNGFAENLESITLEGSKISHIYNGTEESISNELFSSTPFEKGLTNFRLAKMYDKLPDGSAVNTFLTVDDKGNYIWKKIDTSKVIYVTDIFDLTRDQRLQLANNPDMIVAHQRENDSTNTVIQVDYYTFAGFSWNGSSSYGKATYVCYDDYSNYSGNGTANRKTFTFLAYLGNNGKFESIDNLETHSATRVVTNICPTYNYVSTDQPAILAQTSREVNGIGWISIAELFTALKPSLETWYSQKQQTQQPTQEPTQ